MRPGPNEEEGASGPGRSAHSVMRTRAREIKGPRRIPNSRAKFTHDDANERKRRRKLSGMAEKIQTPCPKLKSDDAERRVGVPMTGFV